MVWYHYQSVPGGARGMKFCERESFLIKKVDMKCMLINVLKNTARRLISCLIMSHTCFRVNLHSVVS